MKLLSEAGADEQFNNIMGKLQDNIANLNKAVDQFEKQGIRPVRTQFRMAEYAAEDLVKLSGKIQLMLQPK